MNKNSWEHHTYFFNSRTHGVPSSLLSSAKVVCGHSIMPPRTCFKSRAEVPFVVEHGHERPPPRGSLLVGAELERGDALLESAKWCNPLEEPRFSGGAA